MSLPEFDIKKFTALVEKRHRQVVVVILTITLLSLVFLPSIKFETNLEDFFPENDVVESNDKVKDYFGHDPVKQYVDVTSKDSATHNNIFTIECLREQYNLSKEVLEHEGVEGVLGLAIGIQERLDKKNLSILETNISTIKEALLNSSEGSSSESLEYFTYLENLLLSKDADLDILYHEKYNVKKYSDIPPFAKRTLILIDINSSIPTEERKELANDIREDVDGMEFGYIEPHQTSADLMAYDVDKASNDSMGYLGVLIIVSIIVILYLNFRDGTYVFLSLVTLIIAVIWTLATIVILGIKFTALEVAVVPLIIGMGVDDSVHFSRRYLEERHEGKDVGKSIGITFRSIGLAIFLTSLTTAIAFLSNASSKVGPVRDFGFVCAFGISYAFILTVTFHLALRYWIDANRQKKGLRSKSLEFFDKKKRHILDLDSFMARIATAIHRFPLTVVFIAIVITLASFAASFQVRREFSVEDFLPPDFETLKTGKTINREYEGGTFTMAYVLIEDEDIATVNTLLAIENTSVNIMDDERFVTLGSGKGTSIPLMNNVLVVMDKAIEGNDSLREKYHFVLSGNNDKWPREHYIPSGNTTDGDVKDFFNMLLTNETTMNDIEGLSYRAAMNKLLSRDEEGNFEATVIKVSVRTQSNEDARTVHRQLEKDVTGFVNGERTSVTGYVILLVVTSDTLQESQVKATAISIVLAFIILLIVFKGDVKLGIIGIIPVIFSTLWILGVMALSTYLHNNFTTVISDISLNVLTVTVTALSIGLGIDFAIHVIQRFREDLTLPHSTVEKAIASTLEHTGSALLISALTTMVGFGVLIFSPMPLVRSYGLITSIIIFFSFVSATLVLPVFLMYWAGATGKFEGGAERFKIKAILRRRWELFQKKKGELISYLNKGEMSKRSENLKRRKIMKALLESGIPEEEEGGGQSHLELKREREEGRDTGDGKERDAEEDHILISKE